MASSLLLTAVLVSACGGMTPPPSDSPADGSTGVDVTESTGQPAGNDEGEEEEVSDGESSEGSAETSEKQPTEKEVADAEEAGAEEYPIKVTYFTPAQTEGPFYPVSKPEDRDNDLYVLEGAAARPVGTVLMFGGALYDGAGMPVSGAVIEIWQTDNNGAYLHPADSASSRRDANFQSYGESITDENGHYSFRTVLPGAYDRRPRHIHVKVTLDGRALLTTQFYFSNDPDAAQDRIFAGAGEEVGALIMDVQDGLDFEGNQGLVGSRDIVLRSILSE